MYVKIQNNASCNFTVYSTHICIYAMHTQTHTHTHTHTQTGITLSSSLPDPILSGSSSPDSILARMLLEHFRKASSTLSPVLALVSRNIRPFSCANLKKEQDLDLDYFSYIITNRLWEIKSSTKGCGKNFSGNASTMSKNIIKFIDEAKIWSNDRPLE